MTGYLVVKHAHVTFALLSLTGFLLRAWWMWRESPLLGHRLTRVLPHINDTLLLVAGIWLVVVSTQYPWVHGWLAAKLVALVLYILLGTLALKRGPTRKIRGIAFVAALATFAYMLTVARFRAPWPFG